MVSLAISNEEKYQQFIGSLSPRRDKQEFFRPVKGHLVAEGRYLHVRMLGNYLRNKVLQGQASLDELESMWPQVAETTLPALDAFMRGLVEAPSQNFLREYELEDSTFSLRSDQPNAAIMYALAEIARKLSLEYTVTSTVFKVVL